MAEQGGFTLDDGGGLRVASVRFLSERKFDWDLFRGYDSVKAGSRGARSRLVSVAAASRIPAPAGVAK